MVQSISKNADESVEGIVCSCSISTHVIQGPFGRTDDENTLSEISNTLIVSGRASSERSLQPASKLPESYSLHAVRTGLTTF